MRVIFIFVFSLLVLPFNVNAQTLKPFTSDGCSIFPDGTLEHKDLWLACCTAHDYAYWQGGTLKQKQDADNVLQQCVAKVGQPRIAELMLAGVKVGGNPYLPTPFRWGYGWPYPQEYKALTDEQKQQVKDATSFKESNKSINTSFENEIESLYKANNVTGSILIESADGKLKYQYNVNDKESFIPASTFKIPNTLIMLQLGLIKNASDPIAWDGVKREYANWNQDQTLKTAFQYSCVWCYQRYAKKIGHEKYHKYLKELDYGNYLTGSEITRFWLDGDLRMSVQNQIDFLRKLYKEELPIHKEHIKTLKTIMLSQSTEQMKIWSKTGWSGKDGWYVGYLIINNQTWFFANHLEIKQTSDLALRKKLTLEAFNILNK